MYGEVWAVVQAAILRSAALHRSDRQQHLFAAQERPPTAAALLLLLLQSHYSINYLCYNPPAPAPFSLLSIVRATYATILPAPAAIINRHGVAGAVL